MNPNLGHLPAEAEGKRVLVQLVNGEICGREPVSVVAPTGWAANTARWTRSGHPFDIDAYEVLR